ETLIAGANAQLAKTRSKYRLLKEGGTLKVPDKLNKLHDLVQVVAENQSDKTKGSAATAPVNCDAMGADVGGWGDDKNKRLKLKGGVGPSWSDEEAHCAPAY